MLPIKKAVDSPRLPTIKTAAKPAANAGGKPAAPGAPAADSARAARAAAAAAAADPIRTAQNGSQASTRQGAAPSKTQIKSKAAGFSGAEKSARRDANIGHATVAPAGRERGGGGGFGGSQGHGHPDIQDWMPFSAQQARITRSVRAYPPVGLTKVIAHPLHPFRAKVFELASRITSEVLPSLFRTTPREAERKYSERKYMQRMDSQRKEQRQRSERDEARRASIRKRAETGPRTMMAGELTTAFAMK